MSMAARLAGAAASVLSPHGSRAALLVLTYHRVLETADPMYPGEPDRARFSEQMALVRKVFNVLDLEEAVRRLQAGTLPSRAACITFDDGYANNFSVAAPVLTQLGIPATVFVATGFLDGGRMWNDTVIEAVRHAGDTLDLTAEGLGVHSLDGWASRRRTVNSLLGALKYLVLEDRVVMAERVAAASGAPLPVGPMMNAAQVRSLAAMGIGIGAHTVRHPILARLSDDAARREIFDSRRRLQEITGTPVRMFAYPNGRPGQDYGPQHAEMVRDAGFTGAVTTAWGAARMGIDSFQIPRIAPWYGATSRAVVRIVKTYLDPAQGTF
jgi:peptidoglycan/xylan/chitin deacetylase (PgdA/CDA1 family)